MKRLFAAVRGLAFALSIAVIAGWIAILSANGSGWTRARLERELTAQLGAPVRVGAARIRAFEPAISVERLELAAPEGSLEIGATCLRFGWEGSWAPRLARIDARGGRIVLTPELFESLSSAREPSTATEPPTATPPGELEVALEGIEVALPIEGGREVVLGTLHGVVTLDAGVTTIAGRIDLAAPSTERGGGALRFAASIDGARSLEIRVSGSDLALEEGAPWCGALEPWLGLLEPRGRLALEASASFDLEGSMPPRAHVRASVRDGSARVRATATALDEIALDVDAELGGGDYASASDWRATARATGAWRGSPLEAWAVWGAEAGSEDRARAWLASPRVELGRELVLALGLSRPLEATMNALQPRGTATLIAGARWPRDGGLAEPTATLELAFDGGAGLTYVGWPERPGAPPQGFPIPVDGLSGRIVALYDPRGERRWMAALVRLLGAHSGESPDAAPAFAEGLLVAPPPLGDRPEFDIRVGAHGVPVDSSLEAAVGRLGGTDWIWPSFAPEGGSASFGARLVKTAALRQPAAAVEIDLSGVGGTWEELPVALDGIQGRVDVVVDPRDIAGTGFELYGTSPTGCRVRIAGRVQDDPELAPARPDGIDRSLRSFDVSLENLALRGADRDVIVGSLVGLGPALDQLAPTGKIDLTYHSASARAGADLEWRVEVTPRQVQVTPSAFRVSARGVRGRVLVEGTTPIAPRADEPSVRTRLVPLVGEWPGGSRVAGVADLPSDDDGEVALFGADIDLTNRSLVGAFRESFSSGGLDNLDLGVLDVDGRVDFTGDLELPLATPAVPSSAYRVFLRRNDVRAQSGAARFDLGRLEGILVQREGEMYGEGIVGTLAGTRVVLESARFFEEAGSFRVEARPRAEGLPLDREHLALFLDPESVDALLESFRFRGLVDVAGAELSLSRKGDGTGGEVRFRGEVGVRDAFVDFGVPLSIDRASAHVDDLVYEGGHVRASVRVEGLDGKLADRSLGGARLAFTYVEPHLSVIDVDGELEGGRLRRIERSAGAFGIDLVPPFRFDLGLRLDDVKVEGLLRGLFESDFASSGRLDASLRLEGMLERVTAIRGQGSAEMRDTTLWTIPVVRNLFSQLDLDAVATFTSARSELAFDSGAIHMRDLSVKSPLLELVGSGTLDFDGTLHHDLEVRYALIDRLGPFRRLLYWVQNNLLRVSIRGDMERPRVVLRGMLGFLQGEDQGGRDLPLPSFAPLPERF